MKYIRYRGFIRQGKKYSFLDKFFHISDKVCELQKRSGNFVVGDEDLERASKKSVEDCESECLNDEKCRVMYYANNFCFIVYKDVPPKPYTNTALYYDKVCNHTYSKYSKNICCAHYSLENSITCLFVTKICNCYSLN